MSDFTRCALNKLVLIYRAMKRDAKVVANWDIERIIPCHGDVIEHDAKTAWAEAYKYYLA